MTTVEADLVISTAPEVRVGRRPGDPPGSQSESATSWPGAPMARGTNLWALTPVTMAALAKLGPGDPASVRGEFAVKAVCGAAVVMIKIQTISLRLPGFPKPKPSCGSGTKMATRAGVEEANRQFAERNQGSTA
jgi:hypothetical protein